METQWQAEAVGPVERWLGRLAGFVGCLERLEEVLILDYCGVLRLQLLQLPNQQLEMIHRPRQTTT